MANIFKRWAANPRTTIMGAVTVALGGLAIAHNPTGALNALVAIGGDPNAALGADAGPIGQIVVGLGLLFASDDTSKTQATVDALTEAKVGIRPLPEGTVAPILQRPPADNRE